MADGTPRWSTACPDWAERLKEGRSIIPPPIYPDEAEYALGSGREGLGPGGAGRRR